ncbi:MAG: SusC/RagA family TonB-linked outer membrane protein [Ginsengibacter sp.]
MMKIIVFLVIASCFQVQAAGQKMSFDFKNVPLVEIFKNIEETSGYLFMYESSLVKRDLKASLSIYNGEIKDVLRECLKNTSLDYTIVGKNILLKKKTILAEPENNPVTNVYYFDKIIKGRVMDNNGEPLEGASVYAKDNEKIGTTTDKDGQFSLSVSDSTKILVVNYIGFKMQEIVLNQRGSFNVIRLESKLTQIEDVIITGVFTRQKDHFTGSSSVYKGDDLRAMGNINVLQSLKTLDPSILVLDDKMFGSDPNRLPDMEIRGKSSIVGLKEQYGVDPNQPLFILDGFETSLQTIMDLSLDRIESVTILKDAASTSIYGSKAANGVIVVETKKPEAGKLKLNYSGHFNFQFPDLSDYNLMNSREKLEFERLSGFYSSPLPISEYNGFELYNKRLAEVEKGVNTYWMSEPLRTVLNSRHNIYMEGGDRSMRYGLGLNYGETKGVMKGSDKQIVSSNIDLLYRMKKVRFTNKAVMDFTDSNTEPVPFSQFSRANPYYRVTNDEGIYTMLLENYGGSVIGNPAYTSQLNHLNNKKSLNLNDNFQIEWDVASQLRARGRIGFNYGTIINENYKSPKHPDYTNTIATDKGRYQSSNSNSFGYNGDVSLSYAKLFTQKHQINIVGGWNFNETRSQSEGYSVVGFINDNYRNPSFAAGYQEGSRPTYMKIQAKSTSFFINGNFSYDSRFLLDLNLRSDGSSVFGINNPFTNTWSAGLAWNLHHEKFLKKAHWLNTLKIRSSVGNPGNQNFSAYQAMKTYTYNVWLQNMFGMSALISSFGNNDLKWQKTLNKNIGIDLVMVDNRLRFTFDYFHKDTDPLLAFINAPSSLGTNTIVTNLGRQITKGFDGNVSFSPIYKPRERINWTINLNFRHDKSYYLDMGNALNNLNEANKKNKSLQRYYDNGSADDLWAVPSLGIDPATGNEMFLKKDGSYSFKWDVEDEVVVGNSRPNIEGIIGNTVYYKGVSFSANFRYRLGGQTLATALYNKVENISFANIRYNQDKRAFHDRWKQPGDVAKFRGISATGLTPMSSRFILSDQSFAGESISAGYEDNGKISKYIRASSINFRFTMNDIFRISSIKEERGIEYPFARTMSLSMNVRF